MFSSQPYSDPFAALALQGQRKLAAAGTPVEGEVLPPASPTHEAVAAAVDEVFGLIERMSTDAPAPVKMGVQIMRASRAQMTDGLMRMPAEQLTGALRYLRDRIDAVPGVAGR